MRKFIFATVAVSLICTSCGYVGSGAMWGSAIGSSIGGIAGGFRGHHLGGLIGMAGGAIVGAAVQESQERQYEDDMYQYRQEKARLAANRAARERSHSSADTYGSTRNERRHATLNNGSDDGVYDSGFDSTNSGDDRIELDMGNNDRGDYGKLDESSYTHLEPANTGKPEIKLRNARFVDADKSGSIGRNEDCSIVFEIMNVGTAPAYAIHPKVEETTGNKHISISPAIIVEKIDPGRGVRYTARVVTDNSLKKGEVIFNVSVAQGDKTVSEVVKLTVPTSK